MVAPAGLKNPASTFPMARSFDLDELARRVDALRGRYSELKVHL